MTSISQERSALNAVPGAPNMRRREQWGAARSYTDSRTVNEPATRVFIHISVTNPGAYNSNDAHARAIEAIGISRFPNTGISYNRGIMHDGSLYEFQPIGRRGAHTVNDLQLSSCNRWGSACPGYGTSLTAPSWNLNYNARAYVICQNVGDSVTNAMIDSIAKQIVADTKAGFITNFASHNMHGHRCVSLKSCPGDKMWARMDDLHTKVHHYLSNGLEGDDMPNPVDWTNEDWSAFRDQVGNAIDWEQVVTRPSGEDTWSTAHALFWLERRANDALDKLDQVLAGQNPPVDLSSVISKLDQVLANQQAMSDLLSQHDAGELAAEEVVDGIRALLHDATAPEPDPSP